MKNKVLILVCLAVLACEPSQKEAFAKLHDVQLANSHNSYKTAIEKSLMNVLIVKDSRALVLNYYLSQLSPNQNFSITLDSNILQRNNPVVSTKYRIP